MNIGDSPVHKLTVTTEGDEREYEVEHPAECPKDVIHHYPNGGNGIPDSVSVQYHCATQMELDNDGLDALMHRWRDYLADGEYEIIAWFETHAGGPWGDTEYSGGLDFVEIHEEGGMMFAPKELTTWASGAGEG